MESSRIDSALRLVFPVRFTQEAQPLVWAYHTTFPREVFETYWQVIAASQRELFKEGLPYALANGPVVASLALRDAARAHANANGYAVDGEPAAPILAELARLTLILGPGQNGLRPLPVDIAIGSNVIDRDEWREAESALVFFTCGLWMGRNRFRMDRAESAASAIRGSITSLSLTDYAASLATSTPDATSSQAEAIPTPVADGVAPASSVPS